MFDAEKLGCGLQLSKIYFHRDLVYNMYMPYISGAMNILEKYRIIAVTIVLANLIGWVLVFRRQHRLSPPGPLGQGSKFYSSIVEVVCFFLYPMCARNLQN